MKLEDKIAARKAKMQQASIEIDVSTLFEEEPGTTMLTFTEASANELYKSHDLAKWVQLQMQHWHEEFCETVAVMCCCLNKALLPEEDRESANKCVVHFIESLSLEEFTNFAAKFHETFPHLKDANKAAQEAKKN